MTMRLFRICNVEVSHFRLIRAISVDIGDFLRYSLTVVATGNFSSSGADISKICRALQRENYLPAIFEFPVEVRYI